MTTVILTFAFIALAIFCVTRFVDIEVEVMDRKTSDKIKKMLMEGEI
jgi:hypothetical protein